MGLGREASGRDVIPVPEDAEVEENLALPGARVDRGDAGGGSLELVGQIRDGAGERNDLIVDRAGSGIYVVLERIAGLRRRRSSGICRALLAQPLFGEQRQQLVGLWRQRRVPARRCRVRCRILRRKGAGHRRRREHHCGQADRCDPPRDTEILPSVGRHLRHPVLRRLQGAVVHLTRWDRLA